MPNDFLAADFNIPAGYLDRRISLLHEVTTPNTPADGGHTSTWPVLFSTWAAIQPWKGMVTWEASQKYPKMYVRILFRYRPSQTVTTAMRVQYGSKVYEIRDAYDKASQRRMVELLCEELQSTGSNQ